MEGPSKSRTEEISAGELHAASKADLAREPTMRESAAIEKVE